MNGLKTIHREAMEQTDLALAARQQGDEVNALLHFHKAYEFEARAANTLATELGAEPTRSILFRSAATLALDCNLVAEAEKLICKALIGNPPEQIAEELRDLLEQVHFQRHLAIRGIELRPEDVQMAIAGKEIGYGIAPMESFLKRVGNTENLIYRTAERKQRKPYRDSGRREKALTENFQLYITVPRAASFVVTFKVGTSVQLNLPGLSMGEEIIDELLDCLELYKRGEEEKLREKINEEAYYRNFVSLARTIEPDGRKVVTGAKPRARSCNMTQVSHRHRLKCSVFGAQSLARSTIFHNLPGVLPLLRKVDMVGFTTIRSGTKKEVSLTRTMQDTPTVRPRDVAVLGKNSKKYEESVEVTGLLRFANSLKKTDEIQIVSSGNVHHAVIVPPGMMSDIVKPLWDAQVVITGVQKGRKIHLMQIRAVDPE